MGKNSIDKQISVDYTHSDRLCPTEAAIESGVTETAVASESIDDKKVARRPTNTILCDCVVSATIRFQRHCS